MKKILVVGQTPPPFGGQAMMIKYMLEGSYDNLEFHHVRMCFSKEFNDRGKFSLYKITHIFTIILQIWEMRFRHHIHSMYYPISSAPRVALLRDVIILGCTRFLFNEIIYHFHAAGVSEELPKYPWGVRQLCFNILKKPSLAITSSKHNPKDAEYLQSKRKEIIPLGIPDSNFKEERKEYGTNRHLTVLFMGLLNSTKGEGYILDAINELNSSGRDVRFLLAGKFESTEYKTLFWNKVKEYQLLDKVEYRGVVTGDDKKRLFLESDVFCFPSFFSSESFGIVMLEGMMYQMPIIASRWRGVQSVIEEGRNGYLVDIKNWEQIAHALTDLYDNREKLYYMGCESRKIFVNKYELSIYLKSLEKIMTNN